MEVRNCRGCGRLFNYLSGQNLCPDCKKKLEDKFQQVKAYISDRDNKGASLEEVAEANEVTVKQLKQWVREERLSFSDDSAIGIGCEICGKIIKSGKYCDACKTTMATRLASAMDRPEAAALEAARNNRNSAHNNRMRFLDN